jgi:hypothetical protein
MGTGLSERLRKPGVYVALARKLAVIMLAMWKSGDRYHPYHDIPKESLASSLNHKS